jgi:hypothetical protein
VFAGRVTAPEPLMFDRALIVTVPPTGSGSATLGGAVPPLPFGMTSSAGGESAPGFTA